MFTELEYAHSSSLSADAFNKSYFFFFTQRPGRTSPVQIANFAVKNLEVAN